MATKPSVRLSMGLPLAVLFSTAGSTTLEVTGRAHQVRSSEPKAFPFVKVGAESLLRRDTQTIQSHTKLEDGREEQLGRCKVPGHLNLPRVGELAELASGSALTCTMMYEEARDIVQAKAKVIQEGLIDESSQIADTSSAEFQKIQCPNDPKDATNNQLKWLTDAADAYTGIDTTSTTGCGEIAELRNWLQDGLWATQGSSVQSRFEDLLDGESLSDGLASGHVWTASQSACFAACNGGTALADGSCPVNADGSDSLEAAGGECTEQGDEYDPSCGGTVPTPSSTDLLEMKSELLTKVDLIEATAKGRRSVAVEHLWPETGKMSGSTEPLHEIGYCYSTGLGSKAREGITAAIQHLEMQVPCIKFKLLQAAAGENKFSNTEQENCAGTSAETPSILFQDSKPGCWSPVGLVSGRAQFATSSQPINIGKGCEDMGIVAHELGHTIGMLHEMSRDDRDQYVAVQMANVPESQSHNFDKNVKADNSSAFDFLSLMMYGAYEFSKNGELTLKPSDARMVNFMGQRMGFSELDIQLIGELYKCKDKVTPVTQNAHLSKAYISGGSIDTGFTGVCKDKTDTGYQKPADGTCCATCADLRPFCNHDTQGEEVRKTCPVSCFMCEPCVGSDCPEAPLSPGSGSSSSSSTKQSQKSGAKGTNIRSLGLILGALSLAFLG